MFVGHLAVALSAKTAARKIPLAWLVAAAFALDLLWPIFLLTGVEHVRIDPGNTAFTPLAFEEYPWTHSLLMAFLWGGLASVLAGRRLQNSNLGLIVGGTVVSHWLLDYFTHRPDLPLWPTGPKVGLGLWNSVPATLAVEGALFALGVAAYKRTFASSDAAGRWSLAALVAFTGLIWLSGPWAPPPPSPSAVAAVGLALWVFPLWAAWIEKHHHAR